MIHIAANDCGWMAHSMLEDPSLTTDLQWQAHTYAWWDWCGDVAGSSRRKCDVCHRKLTRKIKQETSHV